MSPKRILGFALIAGFLFPMLACDDVTTPDPPPQDKQITVSRYYTKTFNGSSQTGLQNNDVFDCLVTGQEVWIGNQEGVAVFDLNGGTRRTEAYDQNSGLPNPKVRVVVELDGKLYVGTWGGGLGVFDLTARTWDQLTSADGLVNDLISDIQIDEGKLLIATNGGASMYDPVADTWDSFVKGAGNTQGDLLDDFVSAIAIANTPRGKEYWYMPRWESGIDPGTEGEHGITITRGDFNATPVVDTLQAVMDNTLYEDPDGSLSNAKGEFMFVGLGEDGLWRNAVIKFDIAGNIPEDATIMDARLTMRNNKAGFFLSRVTLHRALADWGEGTSMVVGDVIAGEPATTGDATWKHRFYPDTEWATLGGDYDDSPSGSVDVRGTSFYTWPRTGTLADARHWLQNPSANHGWVLVADDSLKRFATRENSVPANRPRLVVRHAKYFYMTEVTTAFPEPNVNDVFYDEATDLFWIAFSTEGLGTVDVTSATWTFYTTDHGLPSNSVYSIAKVNGVIWVGTQKGLARHLGNGMFQGYDRGGGLPADRVRKVYSDEPSRLWLGFVEGGAALALPGSAE